MAFYRLVEFPASELSLYKGALGRIRARELSGVIVKGLIPADRATAIKDGLERGELRVPKTKFAREFEAYSIGPCLDQSEHGTDAYFEAVPTFEQAASAFLGRDVEDALMTAVRTLAFDRDVVVPRGSKERSYGRYTLRCLPPGGLIPPHAENEQLRRPPYDHLRHLLDPEVLMSFYLTLAPAETGGELSVHAFGYSELDEASMRDRHSVVGSALDARESIRFKPLAGDLIVFDGGRYFHQVLPVGGAKNRWTMGGFLAFSADGTAVLSWA